MARRKKIQPPPWTEDEWHAINSTIGFLKWKTLNKLSEETGIEENIVKLIIEDVMVNDPAAIIKKGRSYKYFHAADCYDDE